MVEDAHGTTQVIPTGSVWGDILERFLSRKFLLTVGVQAVGGVALLRGIIGGNTYVALSSLVLSSYSAASIVDKKLNNG